MENKVIISLDEYLDLRDKVQKIDKLKSIVKVEAKEGIIHNPWGDEYNIRKEIIISDKNLTEYINDILGVRGYELRIEFKKGEE